MAEVRSLAGQHHYSERLVRYNQTSATMNSTPGSHRQTVLISVANSTTASERFNLQGDLHYLYLMFTSHRSRIRLLGPLGPLRVYHFQVSSSPSPTSGQCYPQRSKLKAGTSPLPPLLPDCANHSSRPYVASVPISKGLARPPTTSIHEVDHLHCGQQREGSADNSNALNLLVI